MMVGNVLFSLPFSRITFGLLEDSGYVVYSYRVSSSAWSGIIIAIHAEFVLGWHAWQCCIESMHN